MHNITRDYHIDYGTKRHQNDAISIKLWVEEMRKLGDDCPVLFYKEQGIKSDLDVLDINDFILIIMTPFQAQQLLKFGGEKLCVDGTHGTNSYDFQLYTVLTVDEFGSGLPTAFCFSNRGDESVLKIFFENIKIKVGHIQANIFMSDDAPAFYNAWCHVMSPVLNRLLCTWHIDKNWRQNLSKINGTNEKKALVYKTLRVLLQSTSIDDFNKSLNQVLSDLFEDPDTIKFAEYFRAHYANRPECWAYCYRIGLGINTNMYLESLHKILKYSYLEGKKVKRLDKAIDALMKIARDTMFKRLIKLAKNTPSEKLKKIRESHKAGQNISGETIECLGNNEFLVNSCDNATKKYMVIKMENNCTDNCLKCSICDICLHSFKCSCVDNLIKVNICKHIHACATLFFKNSGSSLVNTNNTIAIGNVLSEINKSHEPYFSNKFDEIKAKAELVIGLCNTASLTTEEHCSVLNHFDKIINILNKTKAINLQSKEKINPNQNIDKQCRLFSTKKKKMKIESNFRKPTVVEEEIIMDNLLNNKTNHCLNIHTDFDHSYT